MMNENEYYLSGVELMKQGKYAAAKQLFTDALEHYTNNADFYSERGVTKLHLNDLKGALSDMNEAQRLEPNKPYRYSSRAFIKDALKDIDGAIEDYKIAIRLDPDDDIAYNNLGMLEEKLGFGEMAQKRYQKADALAQLATDERQTNVSEEIDEQGEALIASFMQELELSVKRDPVTPVENNTQTGNKSLLKTAMSIFSSKEARNEYLVFLRSFFRRS